MTERALRGITATAVGLCLVVGPALAQVSGFRILPPPNPRAVGACNIRWADYGREGVEDGPPVALTWYCAQSPSGEDRRRLTTIYRDDFRNFRRGWRSAGAFGFDWRLDQEPRLDRPVLRAPRDEGAGPLLSVQPAPRDAVLSVLVRPTGLRNQFGLALRVQGPGQGYEIRNDGNALILLRNGQELIRRPLREVIPRRWYWYEVGVRSRRRDVEVRVRVYDETRQRILAGLRKEDLPPDRELLERGGLIALSGPADFAELYLDPWESRWADCPRDQLRWDTSGLADGDYRLLVELSDGRSRPRLVMSDFQVEVRNGR